MELYKNWINKQTNKCKTVFLSSFTYPKDFWFNNILKWMCQMSVRNFIGPLNVTKLAQLLEVTLCLTTFTGTWRNEAAITKKEKLHLIWNVTKIWHCRIIVCTIFGLLGYYLIPYYYNAPPLPISHTQLVDLVTFVPSPVKNIYCSLLNAALVASFGGSLYVSSSNWLPVV